MTVSVAPGTLEGLLLAGQLDVAGPADDGADVAAAGLAFDLVRELVGPPTGTSTQGQVEQLDGRVLTCLHPLRPRDALPIQEDDQPPRAAMGRGCRVLQA